MHTLTCDRPSLARHRTQIRVACLLPALLAASAQARPDLFSNGPYVTHPAGGAGSANLSAVQTTLLGLDYGLSNQLSPAGDRVADDFTLAAATTVSSVVVFGFQRNSSTTSSPFTSINLRIWSGRPGDPGSQVIFGDTATNRLLSATWTGCYRAREDAMSNTERPIYAIEATVNPPLNLASGTYWLDWQVGGILTSGPLAAFVTLLGQPGAPGANARWKGGSASNWITARDSGNNVPQDLAFIVRGTTGSSPPCYANCDGSTTIPLLSANDFQCFLNSFATASPYANCDGSTGNPPLNANDFQCFLNRFASGCT